MSVVGPGDRMTNMGATWYKLWTNASTIQYIYGPSSIRIYNNGTNVVVKEPVPESLRYQNWNNHWTRDRWIGSPSFRYTSSISSGSNTNGYSFGGFFRLNRLDTNQGIMGNWHSTSFSGAMLIQKDPDTLSIHHEGVVTDYKHHLGIGEGHHLMVTMDPSDMRQRLYVDGYEVVASQPVPSLTFAVPTNGFFVGGHEYRADAVYASMDTFVFGWWENRTLTQREILSLAKNLDPNQIFWMAEGSNSPPVMA